jgi:hypothetical protein
MEEDGYSSNGDDNSNEYELNSNESLEELEEELQEEPINEVFSINNNYSPKKKSSSIWKYFKVSSNMAVCQICNRQYTIYKNEKLLGTSNLWKHIQTHSECTSDIKKNFRARNKTSDIPLPTKKNIEKSLINYIISTNQPFNCVEQKSFQQFVSILAQRNDIVPSSSSSIRTLINSEFETYKELQRNEFMRLDSKISFTMDGWTSPNNLSIEAITAHYIDENWNRKSVILAIREMKSSTGVELANLFKKVMKEYNIDQSKILAITMDNASANNSMIEEVNLSQQDSFQSINNNNFDNNENISQLYESSNFNATRVRCFAHIINLVCKEALKLNQRTNVTDNSQLVDAPLTKLRNIIKYVKDSPQRSFNFRSLQNNGRDPLNLQLDCATRWNSTYEMLERALLLKETIIRFCSLSEYKNDLKNHQLTINNGWKQLQLLAEFLQMFKLVSDQISGEKYTTISRILPFYTFLFEELRTWSNNSKSIGAFIHQVNQARSKLREYFQKNCNCISFATILDPRYNFSFLDSIEQHSGKSLIKNQLLDEMKAYNPESNVNISSMNNLSQTSLMDRFEQILKKKKIEFESIETELSRYFLITLAVDMDPIEWWKVSLLILLLFTFLLLLNYNFISVIEIISQGYQS